MGDKQDLDVLAELLADREMRRDVIRLLKGLVRVLEKRDNIARRPTDRVPYKYTVRE